MALGRKREYDLPTPLDVVYAEVCRCSNMPFKKELLKKGNEQKLEEYLNMYSGDPKEMLVERIKRNTKKGKIFPSVLKLDSGNKKALNNIKTLKKEMK